MSDSRWQMVPVPSLIINKELKQQRRRRQRERQKIGKTTTLHVQSRFFVHILAVTARLLRGSALFNVFAEDVNKRTTFFFFS